jgi:Fuc2NAc and GlcNAc transferase
MSIFLFVFIVAAVSLLSTWRVREHALRTQMLDIPSERSSHVLPTPRGGGAGFVFVVLLGAVFLFARGAFDLGALLALLFGGSAVACIGWLDDRSSRPARLRFAVHCAASAWALCWVGVPEWGLSSPLWGGFFFLVFAWCVNLYNFMDGIDGIAGGEAVAVGVLGAFLCEGSASALCLLAASAALGFLPWNWPRAKIFMGDVGSGFLGFVFALAWLLEARVSAGGLFVLPVLLGCFLVDATLTLLWRVFRGEKWYAAHRLHVYQTFSSVYGHRAVTLVCVGVTVFWLGPWAWAAREWGEWGAGFAAAAYLPLAGFVVWVHLRRTAFGKRPAIDI